MTSRLVPIARPPGSKRGDYDEARAQEQTWIRDFEQLEPRLARYTEELSRPRESWRPTADMALKASSVSSNLCLVHVSSARMFLRCRGAPPFQLCSPSAAGSVSCSMPPPFVPRSTSQGELTDVSLHGMNIESTKTCPYRPAQLVRQGQATSPTCPPFHPRTAR